MTFPRIDKLQAPRRRYGWPPQRPTVVNGQYEGFISDHFRVGAKVKLKSFSLLQGLIISGPFWDKGDKLWKVQYDTGLVIGQYEHALELIS